MNPQELCTQMRSCIKQMQTGMALLQQAVDALEEAEQERESVRDMLSELPLTLTPDELAELAHCHPNRARKMCADGVVPATKIGQHWVIPRNLVFREILDKEAEWTRKAS